MEEDVVKKYLCPHCINKQKCSEIIIDKRENSGVVTYSCVNYKKDECMQSLIVHKTNNGEEISILCDII